MNFDVTWRPLEDVVDDIIDRRGVTPLKLGGDFTATGHRVISAKLIKDGRIKLDADEPRFVDETVYRKWMRTPLRRSDVIMTSEAPLGEVAYLNEDVDWVLGQRLFSIRPNSKLLDGRFLYYALQTEKVKADLHGRASGSTVQGIRQAELRRVQVPLPDLSAQRAASSVLGAIDDRITLLRETNTTLEAIAQALFKSWFVDFDPVHAKMQGRAPEGMDEATAALFPDSFEDSELGPVPKGWNPTRLDSFIELAYGKALKSDSRRPGSVPVYGSGGVTGWHDTALVKEASVVVGRKGTVGSIYWESRPFFPIDTVFYVKASKPLTYCHQLLMTLGLNDMNTDAAVPGLNRENVYRLQVPTAPSTVTAAFDEIVSALRGSIDRNAAHAQALSDVRDALLPRLISGQLTLPDVQAIAESA